MQEKPLLYQVENNIATFTINRPEKRNSLTPAAIENFLEHLGSAEEDQNVRAICITGAGNKAFCAGAELGNAMTGQQHDAFDAYASLLKRITGFAKPTLAKVNGYCLAGGMGLMLACDLVIASDRAQFGTPEVNVGLFPMMIGALVFRNISRKKAMEMILLGQRMDAVQALELDMINRIVTADELDKQVEEILRALAAKSPIGMKIGKQAFYAMSNLPFEPALDLLAQKLKQVAATQDAKEGIEAFMQKRSPVFTGR